MCLHSENLMRGTLLSKQIEQEEFEDGDCAGSIFGSSL